MKKFVSTMLSLVMIVSLTTCGFAAADVPATVAISADESFTSAQYSSSETVVSGLYSLIGASKRTSVKAADVRELAQLVFSAPVSGNQVADAPYTVYKSENGSLYIVKNKKLYQIDAQKFYSLADESGIRFYKYRSIPTARVSGEALTMSKSSYKFKKLDGLFYNTNFVPDDCGVMLEYNGAVHVPEFSVKPKSVKTDISYSSNTSSEIVWNGDISEVKNFKPAKSGNYNVRFTAAYENPYYEGEVVYGYSMSCSVGISFAVEGLAASGNGAETVPGEVVVLRAFNIPENSEVTVKSDVTFTPSFFRRPQGDMIALMPVNYYTSSGSRYVELSCDGVAQKFTLDIKTKKFVEQYLTVPPATTAATISSQKANDEFEKYIAPIRYVSDDKQYWSGRFIWPLKNLPRRTTEFGVIRYTNGDMKNPSRHGAIDFAAAAGTPVYAPAAGRVLYSGNLQLTGNTICIEHGYGLKTWYYHMNGRNVKTGDMVTQGQQIGIVGATGFSTGAHLHYGMSVSNTTSGNVFINPETAVATDLLSISGSANG